MFSIVVCAFLTKQQDVNFKELSRCSHWYRVAFLYTHSISFKRVFYCFFDLLHGLKIKFIKCSSGHRCLQKTYSWIALISQSTLEKWGIVGGFEMAFFIYICCTLPRPFNSRPEQSFNAINPFVGLGFWPTTKSARLFESQTVWVDSLR
jgi:hypothetical protein